MTSAAWPLTTAEVQRGIAAGWQWGAQLYVSRRQGVLADLAWGESRPGEPLTPDSLMLWFSSSKPVAAAAILQLAERGLLGLDDRVAVHVPQFGCRGKEPITIRHLLTHTGGFRWADLPADPVDGSAASWEHSVQRVCQARLERDWTVGAKAGYHASTSWYMLGEIVRRLSGDSYADYVRREIFLPLGMNDAWIGMPAAQYQAYGTRIGLMPNTDRPDRRPHRYSSENGAAHGDPGGGGLGPMHDLGRFYEMLLGKGERAGIRVLSEASALAMVSPQRVGMHDETFKHVMDWGLGLILNSRRHGGEPPYGYGRYASDATFGHGGSQSSVAFADPARDLVVAAVFNGTPGETVHQPRMTALLEAVYADLGWGA